MILPQKNHNMEDKQIKYLFREICEGLFADYLHKKKTTLQLFIVREFEKGVSTLDFSKYSSRKALIERHPKKFDSDNILNDADTKILKDRYNEIMKENNIPTFQVVDEEDPTFYEFISNANNNLYKLSKKARKKDVNEILSKEKGDCEFTVDWSNIKIGKLNMDKLELQRTRLRIISKLSERSIIVYYEFYCLKCGGTTFTTINDILCNNYRCICKNIVLSQNGNAKECGAMIPNPHTSSIIKTVFSYQAEYRNPDGTMENIIVDSYEKLDNLDYDMCGVVDIENEEAVFLSIAKTKIPFPVIDFSSVIKPDETPRSVEDTHNFLEDILAYIDAKIKEISGFAVFGMYDIKIAMLFQKYTQIKRIELNQHIFMSGFPGTGKTYLFSLYGKFLFHMKHKVSDANSISVASLRGSSTSNKTDIRGKKSMSGLFGMFDCIYIDETKTNPELLAFLKSFLLSPTYSNDKSDGDKIAYTRTAQVCIAENPDMKHLAKYQKNVQKKYESLQDSPIINTQSVGEEPTNVIEWDTSWDLFQPLVWYKNKTLRLAIKYARETLEHNMADWIDGTEIAINERFPFKYNIGGHHNNLGDYSFTKSRLDKLTKPRLNKKHLYNAEYNLVTENIDEMFRLFAQFEYKTDEEAEKGNKYILPKLEQLFDIYDIPKNSRFANTVILYTTMTRVFNKRMEYNQVDVDMAERFIIMSKRVNSVLDMQSLDYTKSKDLTRIRYLSHWEYNDKNNIKQTEIPLEDLETDNTELKSDELEKEIENYDNLFDKNN